MANLEMDAALQREIEQARHRGTEEAQTEPRAVKAWYDSSSDRLCVDLRSGVGVMIPRRFLQGLAEATLDQVTAVEVTPSGYGLHWEELDVDLAVPQLVAGIFGTRSWMANFQLTQQIG